jgi:muramidase (phage lysozyme)
MDLGEKIYSSMARGIEKTGRFIGLKDFANRAQADRVAAEGEYLQNEGRGVAAPAAIKGTPSSTDAKGLLDTIGKHESGGNYNAVVGDAKQNKVDFSKMTIAEVQAYQDQMKKSGKESTAIGKYQMIKSTLGATVKQAGMDPNTTMFTPEVQDQLATQLLKNRGLDKLKSGQISSDQFATNISKEWASLPKDASGKGSYDGVGSNRALVGYGEIQSAIGGAKAGGALTAGVTGPSAAYTAMTPNEANRQQALYTPPPAAAPIPASTDQPVQIMVAQLDQLQQLVASMKTQVAVSEKLLRMQS